MPSFNLFDSGRPTGEQLLERFGVRPPDLYLRFAQWCFDRSEADEREAQSIYWRLLSLESYDVDSTGYASPYELFSIGDWDGDQVGWVVMAPELEAKDFPWIWYLHDGSSVSVLASDTATFFTRALSYAMASDPDVVKLAEEVSGVLGITTSVDLGQRVAIFGSSKWYEGGEPRPELTLDVPEGWRYQPPHEPGEGVGVLGPASEFAPVPHVLDRSVDQIERAAELGNEGFSASALWHLLLSPARLNGGSYWTKYIKQAYLNLGRPQMAARVERFDA
jgi:hypothetical protein